MDQLVFPDNWFEILRKLSDFELDIILSNLFTMKKARLF